WRTLSARVLWPACLLVVMAGGGVWLGGDLLVARMAALPGEMVVSGDGEAHAGVRRVEVWQTTWQLIKSSPVVCTGFGGYWVAVANFHDASGKWTPEAAHNDYLELLASGGLIGAALGAWFIVAFIRCAARALRSPERFQRAACAGALTGLCGVAAHSFVDFGLHVTINAQFFVVLIVVATLDVRRKGQCV